MYVYIYIYVYMYVCMCVYIYIYIYTYTHMYTSIYLVSYLFVGPPGLRRLGGGALGAAAGQPLPRAGVDYSSSSYYYYHCCYCCY